MKICMHIDSYSPGNIVIDGKSYEGDVIIYPDHVFNVWWRKDGHHLQLVDLKDILAAKPEVLVIGTGYAQAMKVDSELVDELKAKGIEVHVAETHKAVDIYNSLPRDKKVIAGLHLTC